MAGPCPADFQRMAAELGGFTCADAHPIMQLRNPFGLTNWTLPVLEALIVGCAVLALLHAVRRLRTGDPIPMALWWAPVVYLLIIEPPVYFPHLIGAQETMGVVFVHNVFTVEFMWDRLPLYIVSIYPALTVLAYEVVRGLGVFARRGALAGALSVGFVHHCFYEVFDHMGPQRNWWLWNADSDANQPAVAAVPLNSIFLFASLGPVLVTAVVMTLARRRDGTGLKSGPRLVGAILAAGIVTPIGLMIAGIPGRIAGGAEEIVLWTLTAAILLPGSGFLVAAWRERVRYPLAAVDRIPWASGTIYLAVFAVLWASSLPGYLAAEDGVTARGTLIGSLPYAALCWLACALALLIVRPRRAVPVESPVVGAAVAQ